jgi:hypothetical protein
MSARGRFVVAWVLVLVVAGCVWWGIHPPRDASAYREESTRTVQLLRSHVGTARLWIEGVDEGRLTRTAASVALVEASTDADAEATSYSSLDPGDAASTRVWSRVSSLADEVAAALAEVRVAARAGRWDDVVAVLPKLERLSAGLADLHRSVGS